MRINKKAKLLLMVCLMFLSLFFGLSSVHALTVTSGGTAAGVEVRETFSIKQDKYLAGAHDLHFKLWQQEDNIEVNGWEVIISDFTRSSSVRSNQPEPAHSTLKNGGGPPTSNPDNGRHAVDVDASFATTIEFVPYGTEVQVESTFWLTRYNTKRIESTWTRRDEGPKKAVPDHGWEVGWPYEGATLGEFVHEIIVTNDDPTETIAFKEFAYLATMDWYESLTTISFPAPIPDFTLAPGESNAILVTTPGAHIGGHVYFKYSVWWDGVKVFDDIADHPITSGKTGPVLDVWRAEVITSPDAQLIAMQSEQGHVLTDLIRTGDIEKLRGDGFTVTGDLGFHMGHIGYNIRPDQSYRRPDDVSFWPLSDVDLREALFRCYDQSRIVDTIYGYIVRPVQSLIPPAQGNWSDPYVPTYPYNPNGVGMAYPGAPIPGDPSDLTAATTILTNAGYVYHGTGYGDTAAYWTYPDTEPVRPDTGDRVLHHYKLWTPTYEVAPTSAQHGAMFVDDLSKIGLAASAANGWSGFEHVPHEFSAYLDMVFGDPLADPPIDGAQFDAYMVFWSLGRFPDHVYDMCHSSQDCQLYPGRYNAPGIIDTQVDILTDIIKTSLDHSEKNDAAWELQERLYDNTLDNAGLAYMQLYSRTYWNGFNPDLRGVVRSPGYGSDNSWTYMNLHWAPGLERKLPDGRTYVNWIWGEFPESFNRMHASTVYAVGLIAMTEDGFMDVNPYTHGDMGAMATSWTVTPTPGGPGAMNVTFNLRKDMYWQDATPYTAWDAKWNWMFLKNNQIPRFTSIWKFIQDVEVIDDYTVTVIANVTSQFLLYDFAGSAALLAPQVWRLVDGKPLATITSFAPEQNTTKPEWPSGIAGYPTGFAQTAGPWFGGAVQGHPQTQLYGVGPWVYVSYVGGVATFERSASYFRITESIAAQKAAMFHAIGDVGQFPVPGPWNSPDGLIDVWDMTYLTFNFGYFWFEPPANPDDRTQPGYRSYLDINTDKIIDLADISSAAFYQGKQREYP